MVKAMSFMAVNSMLHGGFTRMINELQLIKYSKVKLAYYNHVYDKSKNQESIYGQSNTYMPNVFSNFVSPSKYNGIKLSTSLSQKVSICKYEKEEPYMQLYFQTHHDCGAAGYHTHKFATTTKINEMVRYLIPLTQS